MVGFIDFAPRMLLTPLHFYIIQPQVNAANVALCNKSSYLHRLSLTFLLYMFFVKYYAVLYLSGVYIPITKKEFVF